jgi:photosystem II stability/assembly factor-like uncharacterized protein
MRRIAFIIILFSLSGSAQSQWKKIADFVGTDNVEEYVTCVYFLDLPGSPRVGFVGAGSELYKTTDGGVTFHTVCGSGVTDICFKDSLTGWFSTDGAPYCYKTTDEGETWNALNVPDTDPNNPGFAVYYLAPTNKLLVNAGPLIWISTDLGNTWRDSLPYFCTGSYSFWTPSHGIVPVSPYPFTNAFYLETTDGGITWDTIMIPQNAGGGELLAIPGTSTLFDVDGGWQIIIHRSDDFGHSWSQIANLTGDSLHYCTGIIKGDFSRLYIQTDTGMFVSVDSGVTWKYDGGPTYITNFSNDEFYSAKGVTIAGETYSDGGDEGGGLWEEIWPQSGVAENATSESSSFSVVGPYPNPSAPIGDNVSILVHYCVSGITITAQVYNTFGSPVGSAVTYLSDGQVWDRLEIPAPSSAGAYYIHVGVFGSSSILGYTVY